MAVVGGGCSGVLAAIALLYNGSENVTILEPEPALGLGVAYRTTEPLHLLNSRADTMSAEPGHADGFVEWSRYRPEPVGPTGFAPRVEYGRYLRDVLDAAAVVHPGRLAHRRVRVTALRLDGRVHVDTSDGRTLYADRVVLAIGHSAPVPPRVLAGPVRCHPRYVADPWRPGALDAVPLDAPVLLLGTGLTAVDVALSLSVRGLRAPMHAVSRHGLLPQAHSVGAPGPRPAVPVPTGGLGAVLRRLRADAAGGDWRAAVDRLRPYVNGLWHGFTVEERQRFLRHLVRYWEVHRHRMAPGSSVRIRGLVRDGALRVHAATLAAVTLDGAAFSAVSTVDGHWVAGTVVNCTGPGSAARTGLGRRLLADGLARPDPLGLGLDVDPYGRLVARDASVDDRLLVIGPARRGRWWETGAVPEIRAQAAALAAPDARARAA